MITLLFSTSCLTLHFSLSRSLSFSLSLCLSVPLFVCLSVSLYFCLFLCLCLSISLSLFPQSLCVPLSPCLYQFPNHGRSIFERRFLEAPVSPLDRSSLPPSPPPPPPPPPPSISRCSLPFIHRPQRITRTANDDDAEEVSSTASDAFKYSQTQFHF